MILGKIAVTFFGSVLIVAIYWFFFGRKDEEVSAHEVLEIAVHGGFKPGVIKLKKGVKTKLVFKRTDSNSCLEEFILPDFKIKKYLPLNRKVEVVIKPDKTGTYGFHCGMNMYHGKIIVEN